MRSLLLLAAAFSSAVLAAQPQKAADHLPQYKSIGGNPGPQYNYVCPNAEGMGALDCYFDAVSHLYTMCRHVKSIEIIEFGYEKSEEGVNAAKSEYCVDKQKLNITRPYQAALREASGSKQAVEGLQKLQELWVQSLVKLKWSPGESDDQYKARVVQPYDEFRARITEIKTAVSTVKANETVKAKAPPAKSGRDKKARGS